MITSLLNTVEKEIKVQQIAARLLEADVHADSFMTETQEEYDLLYEAIQDGLLPEDFNIGRSGLWLKKRRINPPKAVAFH